MIGIGDIVDDIAHEMHAIVYYMLSYYTYSILDHTCHVMSVGERTHNSFGNNEVAPPKYPLVEKATTSMLSIYFRV